MTITYTLLTRANKILGVGKSKEEATKNWLDDLKKRSDDKDHYFDQVNALYLTGNLRFIESD